MQLNREAKLLTVIVLNTKHADCRIIFMLYPITITRYGSDGRVPAVPLQVTLLKYGTSGDTSKY